MRAPDLGHQVRAHQQKVRQQPRQIAQQHRRVEEVVERVHVHGQQRDLVRVVKKSAAAGGRLTISATSSLDPMGLPRWSSTPIPRSASVGCAQGESQMLAWTPAGPSRQNLEQRADLGEGIAPTQVVRVRERADTLHGPLAIFTDQQMSPERPRRSCTRSPEDDRRSPTRPQRLRTSAGPRWSARDRR